MWPTELDLAHWGTTSPTELQDFGAKRRTKRTFFLIQQQAFPNDTVLGMFLENPPGYPGPGILPPLQYDRQY